MLVYRLFREVTLHSSGHIYIYIYNTIHMYSGITSGRVLNGELLYTKILEANLLASAYRLFCIDFSPLDGTYCLTWQNLPKHRAF